MKTITTLMALLICASSFALPGPGEKNKNKNTVKSSSQMDIMQLSNKTFKIYYVPQNLNEVNKVKVAIYNDQGAKVYSDRVRTKVGFAIPYTLQDLTPGDYTFEVINEDGSVLKKVVSYENLVENSDITEMEAMVKEVSPDKFQLLVVKPNENMVNIRIRDANDVVVHEERVNFEKGFKRVYDFNQLNSDHFTFEISNGPIVKILNTSAIN